MADCRAVAELLSAALDGELPPELRCRVDAHTAVCPRCRAERRRLAETRALLRSLPSRRAPTRVARGLRSVADRSRSRRRRSVGAATAAVALALVAGAVLGGDDDADQPTAQLGIEGLVSEHLSVVGAGSPEEP